MAQYYVANGSPTYTGIPQSNIQTISTIAQPLNPALYSSHIYSMVPYSHGPVTMMMPQPIQPFHGNIQNPSAVQPLDQTSAVQPLGSPVQQKSSPAQMPMSFAPRTLSHHPSPPAIALSSSLPVQPSLAVSASHPPVFNPSVIPLTPQIRSTSSGHMSPVSAPAKPFPSVVADVKEQHVDIADEKNTEDAPDEPMSEAIHELKKNDAKRQYLAKKAQFQQLETVFEDIAVELDVAETKNARLKAKKKTLLRDLMRFEQRRIAGGVIRVDLPETGHPTGRRARGYARCLQPRAKAGGLCYHPILTARAKNKQPCSGVMQHDVPYALIKKPTKKAKE